MQKTLFVALAFGLMACGAEVASDDEAAETLAQTAAIDSGATAPTAAADGGIGQAKAGAVGAACLADADCTVTGTKCVKDIAVPFSDPIKMPGGYCSKACAADAECAASGSACPLAIAASFLPGVSLCMNPCKVASDCREGYRCGASSFGSFTGQTATGSAAATYCLPPSPGVPAGGIPGLPGAGN
ncbi:MAG: hypothetical protein ABW252_02705 [Polyangiales bacterium]